MRLRQPQYRSLCIQFEYGKIGVATLIILISEGVR